MNCNVRRRRGQKSATLLVLPQKAHAIRGGRRRRIISHADRCHAVELIDETISAGARQRKACEILEISTPLSALDPG